MEILNFTTEFDQNNTISRFVYREDTEPKQIYRYDQTKFELREIEKDNTKVICEANIQDIIELKKEDTEVQFQFAQHFFIDTKLCFLIATQTKDGLESFLYFFDPMSCQSTLKRLLFTKKLKGKFTNIFFSKKLKNGNKDYYIMTIGTLDSALYVVRFTRSDFILDTKDKKKTETRLFSCTLLRTDARNAITQEIIVLNSQSKTPPDIFIVSAGSNGMLDFFLLEGEKDITAEPKLRFQRHEFIELPSKLPIVSLQRLEYDSDKQVLLAVGQQLLKPLKISRLLEPSMTVLKLNIKNLICKNKVSMKFPCSTHIMPLRFSKKLWSCFPDTEETRATWSEFYADTFKFGEKHNIFMDVSTSKTAQQVYVDEETCWMLNGQQLSRGSVQSRKQRKRQLSMEEEDKIKPRTI